LTIKIVPILTHSLTDNNDEIWENGFNAEITFIRNGVTDISSFRANHQAISRLSEKPFSVCRELDKAINPRGLESTSEFLLKMRRGKNKIQYCNESDMYNTYVQCIIRDILKCLGLEDYYYFQYQASMVSQTDLDGKTNLKSDTWIVKKRYGFPVAVVAVKQPGYIYIYIYIYIYTYMYIGIHMYIFV
jgi:hypothetical protein